MRKRLRKKLRLREFREDCLPLNFNMQADLSADERNKILDRFIQMIEDAGLQFGGGGRGTEWSGIAETCGRGSVTAEHRRTVLEWLERQPQILNATAGPLIDGWYGSP
ncbi:MAG: DUF469 family protein [Planctomycetaceae bacterium]|jgi:uncharacterized protein|nr:DUF469 family protein [Planctomycetaceae bacterium]MBT6155003.1 DUF469 family protein [Planctomycetaceae bacterium]MBT6487322.1 DUF469 family protein [Planctomycetaceae bacterium]MBT6497488.1 DUF469 family protein [Planctomycetaceae bacterium]